ncbi:hypothetical protein Salat_1124800 [Sesamum alatum]|uniref:Uncharacterized protein n=1 Tax=Sesamum alatum TaxID=300844 RepID=A0AAE2CN28_9LAMI|nr:hypothetical protein Salat_1124800 [Sesamum alatum]
MFQLKLSALPQRHPSSLPLPQLSSRYRQPTTAPISAKKTAKSTDITKVGSLDFHGFISDLEPSPFCCKSRSCSQHHRPLIRGDTAGQRSHNRSRGYEEDFLGGSL